RRGRPNEARAPRRALGRGARGPRKAVQVSPRTARQARAREERAGSASRRLNLRSPAGGSESGVGGRRTRSLERQALALRARRPPTPDSLPPAGERSASARGTRHRSRYLRDVGERPPTPVAALSDQGAGRWPVASRSISARPLSRSLTRASTRGDSVSTSSSVGH